MMSSFKRNGAGVSPRAALTLLCVLPLMGCQDWMAEPVRVQQAYGQSVRAGLVQQIYDPQRAYHPAALAPDGMVDGIKNVSVLQQAYQSDIGSPERVQRRAQLGISGRGGASGGGGGGGAGGGQ